jgi:hypothetical protein
VFHYAQTGDATLLTTLLAAVGAYVGVKEVAKEVKGKKDDDSSK